MNPLVSIIIPTYNRATIISETLNSVKAQTYFNWECILVDDGSSDNTLKVIENYQIADKRFKCYTRPAEKPKGPSSCRNYGIEKAVGYYIIFLDSDDILGNFCLAERINFVRNNSEFDFWIFKMEIFKKQIKDEGFVYNLLDFKAKEEDNYYYELFLEGKFPFVVTCPIWTKKALISLKGFDENLRMLEDPDLHIRAYKNKLKSKTAIDLKPDCYYRIPEDREEKWIQYNPIQAASNYYFLKKHYIENNESVKKNYKRIINLYGFSKPSFKFIIKMLFLGKRHKTIQNKHIFVGIIIWLYSYFNLSNVKGSGYTKLRTKFNTF